LVGQAEQASAVGKRTLTESLPVGAAAPGGLSGAPGVDTGAVSHPLVRMGSRGDDVRECQRKLNLRGASLIEDGVFGGQTDGAVRRFQSSEGIDADGVVGPITWGRLDAGLAATTKEDTGSATTPRRRGPPRACGRFS
jgi:peptidoglycan hydrolase-like protein with peptidoglycan-binding domain